MRHDVPAVSATPPDDWVLRLQIVIQELDRQLAELDALGISLGAGELDLAIARLRSIECGVRISGPPDGPSDGPSPDRAPDRAAMRLQTAECGGGQPDRRIHVILAFEFEQRTVRSSLGRKELFKGRDFERSAFSRNSITRSVSGCRMIHGSESVAVSRGFGWHTCRWYPSADSASASILAAITREDTPNLRIACYAQAFAFTHVQLINRIRPEHAILCLRQMRWPT